MAEFFNPQEIVIFTKKVEREVTFHRDGKQIRKMQIYHVGNTNVNFDTGNCVVLVYPPREECKEHTTFNHKCKACIRGRMGKIVFKKYVEAEDDYEEDDGEY
jgi:hypothetical protein